MSPHLSLCFVIALMAILVAMTHIPTMPRCPFCGKTREHATDCHLKR